jgi:hypothetical protein
MQAPFINLASSEAKKIANSATSCASPNRSNGILSVGLVCNISAVIGVRMVPGQMALILIPLEE